MNRRPFLQTALAALGLGTAAKAKPVHAAGIGDHLNRHTPDNSVVESPGVEGFTSCPNCDSHRVRDWGNNVFQCFDCGKQWIKIYGLDRNWNKVFKIKFTN